MLGHLIHLLEREGHGLAILDAPSTGPGALLLEAPRAVREAAPRGPLADGAAWIHGFLGDPARTGIALVSVPEELPVSEAIDLYQRFRAGFLPVAWLLANRTLPDPFPPLRPTCLDRLGTLPDGWPLAAAASTYRKRLALQERHLDRLRAAVDLPALPLPEVLEAGEPMAARLADAMGTALGQAREGRP
jgi:anion-transporting  ArsA/GET3 family ATPase